MGSHFLARRLVGISIKIPVLLLYEAVMTRGAGDGRFVKETPPATEEPEAFSQCFLVEVKPVYSEGNSLTCWSLSQFWNATIVVRQLVDSRLISAIVDALTDVESNLLQCGKPNSTFI